MLLSDLLGTILGNPYGGVGMMGGPQLPQLPKSPTNATATGVPSAKIPGPYEGMTAMANLANVASESQLRQGQLAQLQATIGLMKAAQQPAPSMYQDGSGSAVGGSAVGGGTAPVASEPSPGHGGAGDYDIPGLYNLAVQAGYEPGDKAAHAAAIAMAESSGNPIAHNTKGEDSRGLMQINGDAWGPLAVFDPLQNMRNSLQISKGGTKWTDWSTFKNGEYQKFLPQALAAARSNPQLAAVPNFAGRMSGNEGMPYAPSPASSAAMPPDQLIASGGGTAMPPSLAGGSSVPISFYGDSIANGTRQVRNATGVTHDGWTPDKVLGAFSGADLRGQTAAISSGITNSTSTPGRWQRDIGLVPNQIAAARSAGANDVVLYGVGEGVKDNAVINQQLAQIAQQSGAKFVPLPGTGAYTDAQGTAHPASWHPRDYGAVGDLTAATQAQPPAGGGQNGIAPPNVPQSPSDIFRAQVGAVPPPAVPAAQPGTGLRPINPEYLAWARQQDQINSILGKRNPVSIEEALKMAPGGSMSPQYLGVAAQAKAEAENRAKFLGPEANPALQGQLAGAKKAAELPYTISEVRPGTVQTIGGVPNFANSTMQKVVDPATGQETFQYMTPPIGQQASAAAPNAPSNLGVAALGPGQREALVARAKDEQTQRQTVISEANAAQLSRATLMNMANETGGFVQGPFAQHAQTAASYLRLINPSYNGQVASYEDFVKNAGALTRQAVKEVSSRAAVQEFNLIQSTLPNPSMSPQGMQKVQNELIGLTDYKLAKAQAQQQWEHAHGGIGNVSGFETAFQQQASPYAFIVARMDPTDRREMFAKLQDSAQGRQELNRIGQQLTFMKQSGLAQ